MTFKILSVLLYIVKWLGWCVQYIFVWPAATLMMLIIMLFRMENITPGEAIAQEVAAVTHNVHSGEDRIFACRDKVFIPTIPKVKFPDRALPVATADMLQAVCHDRGNTITDAKGYAAHIDSSLRNILSLWAVMAAVFAGMALFLGNRPYFYRHYADDMRSAVFRYGPQASRTRTDDSKQGGEHE